MAFKNLAAAAEATDIREETDSLGSGGTVESALYPCTVVMAYQTESTKGAQGLVLTLKNAAGREHRETLYVTSGKDKGQKSYSENDKKEKQFLPGYLLANSLCLLTIGIELHELETEEKVINIWNKDAGRDIPTKAQVATGLLGQEILAGILKQVSDKQVLNADKVYESTGETREENVIDKFFRAKDRMTVVEIKAQAETAAFADAWSAKWTGQVKDRSTKAGKSKVASIGGTGAAPAEKKKSLFSAKV